VYRVAARVLRQQSDLNAVASVNDCVRASMFDGDGSNSSPAATASRPRYSATSASTSGAAGISARSGASVGMKRANVRFDGTKYFLTTSFTSSAVTFSIAVPMHEHEAPVTRAGPLAQSKRDPLRVVERQLEVPQPR
jgi:hypothetical protein